MKDLHVEQFRNNKVLVVGIGKTGFALINFFNKLNCEIKVTDILPIFELNKAVKKLKKIKPTPEMTFGEHLEEDFLESDVIVYGPSVNKYMPQLELARLHGKEVYSQFELANRLCDKPIIMVCGSLGRTTVAHMIGYVLRLDNKSVFVGGGSENPFINICNHGPDKHIDYAVIEVSASELQQYNKCDPILVVFTNIIENQLNDKFQSFDDHMATNLALISRLSMDNYLIVNHDKLGNSSFFHNLNTQVYWYSRRSFIKQGLTEKINGTQFHNKRIHCNIHYHSEFKVSLMRIVGEHNRENLLAAITACKSLKISDKSIQTLIEKFPGIPHRLEFILEKNGVFFYNDSKSEKMDDTQKSLLAFKDSIILIAGGKDTDQTYEPFYDILKKKVRVFVLVGECKERLNRVLGDACQTYLVGSFEESILIAYQKSRTGDIIVLSPGNRSTDTFRDYEERGSYFKKLVFQL